MSTRSHIGIAKPDGSLEVVYCHSDGYPSYNGDILLHHYTDVEKIKELISNGGMSSLEKEIKDCEFFKDRGEEITIYKYNSLEKYLLFAARDWEIEYFYLFDEKENKWFMNKNRFSGIKELTEKEIWRK